ncbi:hypothetical protein [Streptomyces sp. NPDC002491]
MIHFEEDHAEGTATVHFTHVRSFEATSLHGRVDELWVTVPRSSFRGSRTNDQRLAEALKRQLDAARDEIERLSSDRDHWEQEAESWRRNAERPLVSGVTSLGSLMTAFKTERSKYPTLADDIGKSLSVLEDEAVKAVYAENQSGGRARGVVAEVAKALGVDIDEGPGHRWDPEHMARVVERAKWVAESRDYWEAEESSTRRQADELLAADDVDELKATIVRQAREITRLKGEGE